MSILFGPVSTEDQYMCDVFVIMPFKDEFTNVYDNVIKKVCGELNLTIKLGDDFFSNRQIINEIWSAINNCKLVIADCTERNPNVFYELGIAHTLGKSTIAITKTQEDIPFDIQGIRYIEYTDTISGGRKLEENLKTTIEKVIESATNAPISFEQSTTDNRLKARDPRRYQLSLSNDAKILSEETHKARQLNEYDWMELFAEAWVKVESGKVKAYEALATALIRSDQAQKAITVGEKLINLSKINHKGYETLGQAYNLLGDGESARKWLELALRYVTPDFKQFVLIDLLESYERLGLVDEAVGVLEELIPLTDKYSRSSYQDRLDHLRNIPG